MSSGPGAPSGSAPRPPGTMLSLDELNRIVLEFLHKKGYSRTEAMLRLESSRQPTPASATRGLSAPVPTTQLESYSNAYVLLKDWVESSLDMYQPELGRFLFPLFVHLYLELVNLGEPEKAQEFFDKFSETQSLLHPQDIASLRGIRLPEHVSENAVAQRFMTQRYRIRISPTAFDLLLYFLRSIESTGGSTIIRLINQYFSLDIAPKDGNVVDDEDEFEASEENSAQTGSTPGANARPLRLGRLPLEPEFRQEILQMLEYKDSNEPPREKSLASVFEAESRPETDSPAAENLPLPKFRPVDVEAAVQRVVDTAERAQLGFGHATQAALPSVAMYTFHNTYDDLNCVTFSDDAELAAGGFSDSYVMLWSLKGKKLTSAVASENSEDQGPVRRLIGHSGAVYAASFSPDSRTLLTASEDHTVRLWSMDTFTALVAYRGHTEPVWDVAYGPFGHYFATASADQTARLWSVDHIYPLRIFAGHMSDVDCVCFHPNGMYVFTGSSDKTVRMWDVSKGSCVRVFLGHIAPVTALAVSPNGRWVAAAGEDAAINVWDIGSGRRLKKMRGHGIASIYSLSFSMGGEVLVSGAADCTVRVWDMNKNTAEAAPQPEPYDALAERAGDHGGATGGTTTGTDKDDGKRKEVPATTDHMAVFNTKRTPVYTVKFTSKNLVLAAGAFNV